MNDNEPITARGFLNCGLFDLSFMTAAEVETLITAMELYAKGKCREQREICNHWARPVVPDGIEYFDVRINEESILNAPEPYLELQIENA